MSEKQEQATHRRKPSFYYAVNVSLEKQTSNTALVSLRRSFGFLDALVQFFGLLIRDT